VINAAENVDNVDKTVDNIKGVTAVGIILASLGKGELIIISLDLLELFLYMEYERWRQNREIIL